TLINHNPYRGWQYIGDVNLKIPVESPIAEVERLANEAGVSLEPPERFMLTNSLGTNFGSQWPQRLTVEPGQFKGVLDSVRRELLRWAIELEKRGIKGEGMNFDEKEKQSAASQVFNIGTVHGTVGNITNSQVTLYDYSSVQQLLIDHR